MKKLWISLSIGFAAGIIDVSPMVAQKLNIYACLSAFVFWLVMGIVISYAVMPLKGWLKGLVIAEISSLPIVIIVFASEPASVLIILTMSAILGSLIGHFTAKYAN